MRQKTQTCRKNALLVRKMHTTPKTEVTTKIKLSEAVEPLAALTMYAVPTPKHER